ncbi:ABC transporter ATP-binding protein [Candidatus Bathyarchaeota archaeon]|nr:MAG: ABC transporter ATP-binding protein [Candidatus Bathyarchaeota archaeon]
MAENVLAVEVNSVSKFFGSVKAVNQVNLKVGRGCIHGLLGPNGSGKSTLMKMILGLVKPDQGNIKVYGLDVWKNPVEVKRMIGYVPETPQLYEFLTGLEYLDFVGDLYGIPNNEKKERILEFLDAFELKGYENKLIGGYSQGMKQKLAIIAALLHKPKLLILDEPLNGLDPKTAKIVKDLIYRLAGEGVTTLFSTHILEIAETTCKKITIMYEGKILVEGSPDKLRKLAGMSNSSLEEVFLKLTGTSDIQQIVEALAK